MANIRSLFGPLLGFDKSSYIVPYKGIKTPQLWVGPAGSEQPIGGTDAVQQATSATTATPITGSGLTVLSATTLSTQTWAMALPVAGMRKTIVTPWWNSTAGSTGAKIVRGGGAQFQTTAGSSFEAITFNSPGQHINLIGLSSAAWAVLSLTSSAALTT